MHAVRATLFRPNHPAIALAISLALASGTVTGRATAQAPATPGDWVELPAFVLTEDRIANQQPAATFAAPVSSLRFEPRVDLQTRNFGEAQGDIAIRGGIFEGTAVQVGGLTIFDPQTGHYAAELPIAPAMLSAPRVATGAEHAFGGLNATAGTVRYAWAPISNRGAAALAFGNGELNRQSIYAGRVWRSGQGGGWRVATDAEVSRSEAEGTIVDGDHEFFRVAGRLQLASERSQTDFFAGYQSKFFGWPNLYTPFNAPEAENLQTTLVLVSHRATWGESRWEAGAHFRRNKDDYDFNRYQAGVGNPFQHETRAGGVFLAAAIPVGEWTVNARTELARDDIESTSLTAGRFNSRDYGRLAATIGRRWAAGADGAAWHVRVGAAGDDTNREGSAVSPIAELAWERALGAGGRGANLRWYAEFSESTRVPGYTALNSSATGGLFRGNPDLGRESSENLETGVQIHASDWSLHAAVFQRRDDPLVDWTFSQSAPNARTARLVDIETTGVELLAARRWRMLEIVGGYSWLEKDADYRGAPVDASFYALNFPRHRVTLAVTARVGGGFEIRSDNEYRVQQKNRLRTIGGDDAVLSSLGVFWTPPQATAWEVSLVVDNLWASKFQELPAVPAPGRQVTGGVAWRW